MPCNKGSKGGEDERREEDPLRAAHRGEDGVTREKQLLIDFLCASAGGPVYYRGRDMALCHRGMRISEKDWNVFLGHAAATLAKFQVPAAEQRDVVAFVQSLKNDIVE